MSLLLKIFLASFISGVLSLIGGIALLFKAHWVRRFSIHFTSFAVGALLATAFLDLLPEANGEFIYVLLGILGIFVLERLVLKFHPHHHEDTAEHHHPVPTLLMIGDTIHNFIDGILIAISFLTDPSLGVLATFAVAAHELPQEISDFSVMLNHGWARKKVLFANLFSSLASVAGALLGFAIRGILEPWLPQLLALTAGIFIYIAIADLMPDISGKSPRDKFSHVLILLILGVIAVWGLGALIEAH